MAIVGLAICLVGILFMIYYPIFKARNKRRTAMAQGTCIKVEQREVGEDSNINTYYTLRYVVDGKEYILKNVQAVPGRVEEGSPVTICYNPKKPQDAGPHYEGGKTHYILAIGIALFVIGVILVIL